MRGLALLLAALLLLALLAPAVGAQLLPNVPYVDAQQGVWYAVNTGGQSYRVFYLSPYGTSIFVSAYWWDASSNYIVFQAPCSCRVYLRQESYALSTLSTYAWFTPNLPQLTVQVRVRAVVHTSVVLHGWTSDERVASPSSASFASISWSGSAGQLTRTDAASYSTSHTLTSSTSVPTLSATTASSMVLNVEVTFSQAPTSWVGTVSSAYHQIRTGATVRENNAYSWYNSGNAFYYRNSVSAVSNLQFAASPTNVTLPSTGLAASTVEFGTTNYLYVAISVSAVVHVQTVFQATRQADGSWLLAASNGNVVRVYDSLSQLPHASLLVSASTSTFHLHVIPVLISFGGQRSLARPIAVPVNTTETRNAVPNPSPAAFLQLHSAWAPAWLLDYGTSRSWLLFVPPRVTADSLPIDVALFYPIRYARQEVRYTSCSLGTCVYLFPISGTVAVTSTVRVVGNLSLAHLVGSSVVFENLGGDVTVVGCEYGSIGSIHTVVIPYSPDAMLSGNFTFTAATVFYDTVLEHGFSYSVGPLMIKSYQLSQVSFVLQGEVTGSWGYRVPLYITLHELPPTFDSGWVFRVRLPLQTWVRMELLSPALEDLLIVDSAMRPARFYVLDPREGIVYVRYDYPLTSSTVTLYVLLKNPRLWGSGRTFSTLSTFDAVDAYDFTDDFGYRVFYTYGSYNMVVAIPDRELGVKFGRTWYDAAVATHSAVYEQHGSVVREIARVTLAANHDLLFVVDPREMSSVYVYGDGEPLFSVDLARCNCSPVHYIGYRNAKAVYIGRTVLHSYTVGGMQGALERPTPVQRPQQQQPAPTMDWGTLFLMIFAMIGLGVVSYLVQGGVRRGGGGGPLSRF